MKKVMMGPMVYTLKVLYSTVVVIGAVATAITAVFGLLDVTGITQGQVEYVLTLPENLNELVNKGIQALDQYLGS